MSRPDPDRPDPDRPDGPLLAMDEVTGRRGPHGGARQPRTRPDRKAA